MTVLVTVYKNNQFSEMNPLENKIFLCKTGCFNSPSYLAWCTGIVLLHSIVLLWYKSFTLRWGWLGVAKVSCILCHQGVQLILAYIWVRPAIFVAGKDREGMFFVEPACSRVLLVAGCYIGVCFSVSLSKFDIYVKVSILINYKTKQPSNLAWKSRWPPDFVTEASTFRFFCPFFHPSVNIYVEFRHLHQS